MYGGTIKDSNQEKKELRIATMKEELIVDRNQMNVINEMTIEIIEFIKRKIGPEQVEEKKTIYQDNEETIDPMFGNGISIDLFFARNVIRIKVLRDIIKKQNNPNLMKERITRVTAANQLRKKYNLEE
jgi:hypothetical protein